MAAFTAIFGVVLTFNIILTIRSSSHWNKILDFYRGATSSLEHEVSAGSAKDDNNSSVHSLLLRKYLCVYLLAALSDWLQGPYVYALYAAYGFSKDSIAVLFVAGFGSSMAFGSFIGSLADVYGRRNFTLLFVVIYAASCLTKHFNNFGILMVGRLLGGIATSLLFSVFDSWLIRAHNDAGVSSYLPKSFSAAAYGNSVVAILAGLFANYVASLTEMAPHGNDETSILYFGGFVNPFDLALTVLCVCGVFAAVLWEENYGDDGGDKKNKKPFYDGFKSAFFTTMQTSEILLCGIICALFEGSMYIFVFMWTPSMTDLTKAANPDADVNLPFGVIFSTFMVSCMAGSSIFSIVMDTKVKVERIGVTVFSIATGAFACMTLSNSDTVTFLAFLVFEVCCGTYFPMMGTMKSSIVPENKRAAIYNLYRVPLNFIVISSLLVHLSVTQAFALCTIMMMVAILLQRRLVSVLETLSAKTTRANIDSADVAAPLLESSMDKTIGSIEEDV